jgi:hypothetical protein
MSNISNIIAAVDVADYPPVLVDARTFQAAASELLDSVKVEQPPDLNSVTLKTLVKTHARAVESEVARDVKVKHAEALVKIAVERAGMAEQQTASQFEPWFAEQFNAAAKRLVDVIAERGGVDPTIVEHGSWQFDPELAELRTALANVAKWGRLRTDFVYRHESQPANVPMSIPYERHSRTAILADHPTAMVLQGAATRYQHMGDGYWLVAAQTPGVTLCWQTPEQQAAQPEPANVTRERAAMADQMKAREAAFKARRSA